MNHLFHKAKHWQVFLLLFGVPMILQFIFMGKVMFEFNNQYYDDMDPYTAPTEIFYSFKYLPLILIIVSSIFLAWQWSMGVGLQKYIPEHIEMKVKRFKFFLIFPYIYMLFFMTFFSMMYADIFYEQLGINTNVFIIGIFIILPLHLFTIFCLIYVLYFVAKTFKTAELQREVSFSDFVGEFFLIWFYPIGIWLIQPKINKMVKSESNYLK